MPHWRANKLLCVHVLNVGNGDSLVLEHREGDQRSFAVVDSNQTGPGEPPALIKLQELGAERLSFVALTHPHADHYKGLLSIMEAYRGRIGSFITFPLWGTARSRLPQFAKTLQKVISRTDSTYIRGKLEELIRILVEAKDHIGYDAWFQQSGPSSRLYVDGFQNVSISTILPPNKVKGRLFDMISRGDAALAEDSPQINDLSLAFSVSYAGQTVVLGGDGTYANWCDHRRTLERANEKLAAQAAKLPHHGALDDCRSPVLDHLFASNGERYACISADGHRHPHPDVYEWLRVRNVQPYCTNLAKSCGAGMVRGLIPAPELDPALARFINTVAEEPTPHSQMPCQGHISLCITPDGQLSIAPQYNHPCPYRGGYSFLH